MGLPDYRCRVPSVDVGWSYDHLISTLEFPVLVRGCPDIESTPGAAGTLPAINTCKTVSQICGADVELWNAIFTKIKTLPHPKTCKNYAILFVYFYQNQEYINPLWPSDTLWQDRGQHWLRWWLVADMNQATTWYNANLSSGLNCNIKQ